MLGNIAHLIKKDFYVLMNERSMGVLFVLLVVFGASFASYVTLSSLVFVLLIFSSFTLNMFNLDEKFRTEKFFASLPVCRRDIVLSRYGGILTIAAVYFVLAYIVNAGLIFFGRPHARFIPFGYCAMAMVIIAFITAFTFPFYFKLGVAKAKTVTSLLMALFMGIGGAMAAMPRSGGSNRVLQTILSFVQSPFPEDVFKSLLVMGAAVLLLVISCNIAVSLYARKDF